MTLEEKVRFFRLGADVLAQIRMETGRKVSWSNMFYAFRNPSTPTRQRIVQIGAELVALKENPTATPHQPSISRPLALAYQ